MGLPGNFKISGMADHAVLLSKKERGRMSEDSLSLRQFPLQSLWAWRFSILSISLNVFHRVVGSPLVSPLMAIASLYELIEGRASFRYLCIDSANVPK
jgi:hypothetical protein